MKTDTLIEVKNAFKQWRANRSSSAEKTPQQLRNLAVSLLTQYSSAKITTALRISGANLKLWRNEITTEPPEFIELAPAASAEPAVNHHLDISLQLNNDSRVRLSGNISPVLLTALVEGLTL